MIEKMEKERTRLEGELKKGQQMLIELQQKANNLTANMQRIQGAIQFIDGQLADVKKQVDAKQEVPETKDEPK